ncbi:MAG: ABC transporter permease [Solirubrobacteraceae bacterium]|nr:ABC transporter permease [Solirubrobacteraceae bacterium]
MRKVVLRGLVARKLRFTLTLLAVALGVALIAATYVFTDTINASFDRIFQEGAKNVDAAVTAKQGLATGDQGGTARVVPFSVLGRVEADPGVEVAEGNVFDSGTILGRDGERIGRGAPNFIASASQDPRFETFRLDAGRFPRTADEALVDKATADKEGFRVGGTVQVQGEAPRKAYEIVGIGSIAGVSSFGGAAIVELTLDEAVRMLGKPGYDQVIAAARPGVTPEALVRSLRADLPRTLNVRTGEGQADEQARETNDSLGFLRTALLAFAGIALFVGAFIIFNSFSITVQQRLRELGLLRTMGASRRQVLASVIAEGLLIGFAGSLLGLALGLALAPGLKAMFVAFGIDLPTTELQVQTRTIVVALAVGTVVSMLASIAPAVRATRVPPMAALRESAAPTTARVSRRATILALLLTAAGVVLICLGLFGSGSANQRLGATGAGVAVAFLGVALLTPFAIRPLASLMGRPVQAIAGFPGRLARENAVRQPARTAATAAALMVGVALVTFATIFAAGARTTVKNAVEDNLKAPLVVQNSNGFSPFSPAVVPAIRRVDGVEAVSALGSSQARIRGIDGDQGVTGVDPATLEDLWRVQISEGPPDAVAQLARPGTTLVRQTFADDHGTEVGDTLVARTPVRGAETLRVVGILDDEAGLFAALTVSNAELVRAFGERKTAFAFVATTPGAPVEAVQQRIDRLLEQRFPEAEVKTQQEFVDAQSAQVNQLLGLIYALLSLAIIVSLFGIVNTLVLSISERTREIGMLRAVGTTQRQVRRVVRWEAVITALIGGLIGAVVGVILAILFTQPLDGFTLAIPVWTILGLVVLSGLAGVLAAALPARRAARLDVLEALAYE